MEQIYPLHEDNIKRFCGMPVCVVTNEGQRHVGVLSRCHEGRIMLNERPASAGANGHGGHATSGVQQGKVTNQKSSKQKKGKTAAGTKTKESAQTQAYYPYDPYGYGDYGYGGWDGFGFGEALAFDLATIAFLFLLI